MHLMIATKQVVAYWNDVVKRAGCGEENHDKRESENNRPVVPFHQCIESDHILTPGKPIRLP